jgi:3D (Asp-Asp-Asp) domain-containing protein
MIFTTRPHLWPNYFVLAGILFKILVAPHVPVALAEQSLDSGYGMPAIEAVQSPNPKIQSINTDENNFILSGSFINPNYLMYSSYKLFTVNQAQKSQRAALADQNLKKVIVTAYSSTSDQTDSTPFISANGKFVYDGMVACNFLPFGAKVRFPEIYGDKIFVVEDRMAWYNSHKIDIWMPDRQTALQFGVKKLAYEVVK